MKGRLFLIVEVKHVHISGLVELTDALVGQGRGQRQHRLNCRIPWVEVMIQLMQYPAPVYVQLVVGWIMKTMTLYIAKPVLPKVWSRWPAYLASLTLKRASRKSSIGTWQHEKELPGQS
jgi:hypothetical protein